MASEYMPPQMNKPQFMRLVNDALGERYSFLTINMRSPWETRFRKGLARTIDLSHYRGLAAPKQATGAPILDPKK